MPGLYIKTHWQTANLPIMTNSIYDVKGESYQAAKVVNKNLNLDYEKFKTIHQ